ncbi:BT3 [Symbiodinium sp. CCMP2592]|nr:BT3 [Symbiodinium sp. CCMP2592]
MAAVCVKNADLAGLQRTTNAGFDWRSYAARELLQTAIDTGLTEVRDKQRSYLNMVKWMVKQGADPFKKDSSGRSAVDIVSSRMEPRLVEVQATFLKQMLRVLAGPGSTPRKRETVELDRTVLQRWKGIRNKADSHNVAFQTAEGPVTAHDVVLAVASPVLAAMLESTMAEGTSKCIQVEDSSAAAVGLFLDMVYMSATDSELEYKTVLGALDLSHRWQVPSIVRIFENILEDALSNSNFQEIAEAAALKDLVSLKQACVEFAQFNSSINDLVQQRRLHPAVMKLLGAPELDDSPAKKLRTF